MINMEKSVFMSYKDKIEDIETNVMIRYTRPLTENQKFQILTSLLKVMDRTYFGTSFFMKFETNKDQVLSNCVELPDNVIIDSNKFQVLSNNIIVDLNDYNSDSNDYKSDSTDYKSDSNDFELDSNDSKPESYYFEVESNDSDDSDDSEVDLDELRLNTDEIPFNSEKNVECPSWNYKPVTVNSKTQPINTPKLHTDVFSNINLSVYPTQDFNFSRTITNIPDFHRILSLNFYAFDMKSTSVDSTSVSREFRRSYSSVLKTNLKSNSLSNCTSPNNIKIENPQYDFNHNELGVKMENPQYDFNHNELGVKMENPQYDFNHNELDVKMENPQYDFNYNELGVPKKVFVSTPPGYTNMVNIPSPEPLDVIVGKLKVINEVSQMQKLYEIFAPSDKIDF